MRYSLDCELEGGKMKKASKERTEQILHGLYDAVVNFDEDIVAELGNAALEEGIDPFEAINKGLAAGMEKVGELYANRVYFVPELLLCSDALYAGLDILKPHLKAEEQEAKLKIVIGTVEGDIHDIGKNLVRIMFEAAGWTVYDLGKDVKLGKFVEEQERTGSDVVALSALMTTSMLAMPKVIEMIKARNPKVAVIVGGAPVTRDTAKLYGADGYADNAGNAVQEVMRMLGQLQEMKAK
jgi:corrinoid protein of di/trimethylamine methyltransferase